MIHLVTGGSGSGKSEYAENWLMEQSGGQKELLPLTGYIHGGCSPIGMKKPFPTVLHQSAAALESIYVSAGKVGFQVQLSPGDLQKMLPMKLCDVIK